MVFNKGLLAIFTGHRIQRITLGDAANIENGTNPAFDFHAQDPGIATTIGEIWAIPKFRVKLTGPQVLRVQNLRMIEHTIFDEYITGATGGIVITSVTFANNQGLITVMFDLATDAQML